VGGTLACFGFGFGYGIQNNHAGINQSVRSSRSTRMYAAAAGE
jgi:hypothetical protein